MKYEHVVGMTEDLVQNLITRAITDTIRHTPELEIIRSFYGMENTLPYVSGIFAKSCFEPLYTEESQEKEAARASFLANPEDVLQARLDIMENPGNTFRLQKLGDETLLLLGVVYKGRKMIEMKNVEGPLDVSLIINTGQLFYNSAAVSRNAKEKHELSEMAALFEPWTDVLSYFSLNEIISDILNTN